MDQSRFSVLTFPPIFPTIILIVFQIIPIAIPSQEADKSPFQSKLKALSQNTPLGLEQAPAESVHYQILSPPNYNHPYDPQSLQVHRRASHADHGLNLHYRKLDEDELQNRQYLKPIDQESLSRLYRKPQEEIPIRQYQRPAAEDPNNFYNGQYQRPDDISVNRQYRKPQQEDILKRQYQRPVVAQDPTNFNNGRYQQPEDVSISRQYRKPQEESETTPESPPAETPAASPETPPAAAPENPTSAPETPPTAAPENPPTDSPENSPTATEATTSTPREPLKQLISSPDPEEQLKAQKMELLKLIDQVGFDKAIHIFDNRVKSELNPQGPPPTNQESTDVRNNVLKNLTTYHIYKPLVPLIEIIEPPTTTTTLKPQFPDNEQSPIENEYGKSNSDDFKSAQDEQQEARENRDDLSAIRRSRGGPVHEKPHTVVTTKKPTHNPPPPPPVHQVKPNPTTKTTTTTTTTTTPPPHTRHSNRTRPTFRKTSPKFSVTTTTPVITPPQTTSRRRCPTFLEFRIGAVILWERLKNAGVFGGVHLIVEAIVEALKSLGICFFSISGEVVEAISNFFSDNPHENKPEANFLNSSQF